MNTNSAIYTRRVSICIPTFNGAEFLQDALSSAFKQTYADFEVVVSDDNSHDDTLTIVKDFQIEYPGRIRIIHHEPRGIGANWNNSIAHAEGEYIKLLMQDDVLEPTCLEHLVTALDQYPTAGLAFSRRRILVEQPGVDIDRWLKTYGDLQSASSFQPGLNRGSRILKDPNLLKPPRNKIGEPTAVLLRRSVLDRVGQFDERLKQSLDYEFWYRILAISDAVFLDTKLVGFRLHPNQATVQNQKVQNRAHEELLICYHRYLRYLFWKLAPPVRKKIAKAILRNQYHQIRKRIKNWFY